MGLNLIGKEDSDENMVYEFKLPDVGEGINEADLLKWMVDEGDGVLEDDPIAEVETERAIIEIPSPVGGKVLELHADEGDTVSVGATFVTLDTDDETGETHDEGGVEILDSEGNATVDVEAGDKREEREEAGYTFEDEDDDIASHSTKLLAREVGVDIDEIEGSGADGRVVAQDVLRAAKEKQEAVEEENGRDKGIVPTTDAGEEEPTYVHGDEDEFGERAPAVEPETTEETTMFGDSPPTSIVDEVGTDEPDEPEEPDETYVTDRTTGTDETAETVEGDEVDETETGDGWTATEPENGTAEETWDEPEDEPGVGTEEEDTWSETEDETAWDEPESETEVEAETSEVPDSETDVEDETWDESETGMDAEDDTWDVSETEVEDETTWDEPGSGVDAEEMDTSDEEETLTKPETEDETPAEPETTEESTVPFTTGTERAADRLVRSADAPLFTHHDMADAERLVEVRERLRDEVETGLTYTPFLVKACGVALEDHRVFGSAVAPEADEGDEHDAYGATVQDEEDDGVDVSVAVETEDGLRFPAIRNVDQKGVAEIAEEIDRLAERARTGETSEEAEKGTFTVYNVGGVGGEGTTVLPVRSGTAAVGIGEIRRRPYVVEDEVVARYTVPISLTFDIRVVEPSRGARFTNDLKRYLNDPMEMLL